MLTDEQIEILSDALTPLYQNLEAEVITDIARRIKKTLTYTHTAQQQIGAMRRLGYSPAGIRASVMELLRADRQFRELVEQNTDEYRKEINGLLADVSKRAAEAGEGIIADAGELSWSDDLRTWNAAGKTLGTGSRLGEIVEVLKLHTAGELKNLTGSAGFRTVCGFEKIRDLYRLELDRVLVKMSSGAFSPDQCIRDTVRDLARSGIRTIDYASGRSYQLDTAARMCLRTAGNRISARVMDMNLEETGESLVQVSAHWGARNKGTGIANHAEWQGGIYSTDGKTHPEEERRLHMEIRDLVAATGYDIHTGQGDIRGLHGINCRHKHFVFFEGASTPVEYPMEPGPKKVNGVIYDYYAMTQKQRQAERSIKALKRERDALDALGQDTADIRSQIRRQIKQYREFSGQCGISPKMNRIRVEGGTSDLTGTKAWKRYKNLKLGNREGLP